MVQKTAKKKNQLPSEKLAYPPNPKPWPNLPPQLISSISRQPNLMQNITSFGCVTKSWRSPSKQCSRDGKSHLPKLVEINGKKHQKNGNFSHVIGNSLHDQEYPYWFYRRRWNEKWQPGVYFKGHSHGELVTLGTDMSQCYLWQPARISSSRCLPPWDRNLVFKTCTLSSSPEDRNGCTVMVLTGTSSPAFAFCKWGRWPNRVWTTEDCKIKELYDPNKNMQFTNAIGFQGKFYALSLQGSLVEIEEIDSCFRITRMGANRAVPSGVSRQFREYLVELYGEILLVFLISRKFIDVVECVEVFRLDIRRLLWVKMRSLGETALFLEDECCMGVAARKVGCKKNCVYFTHHRVDAWWIFDMEVGNIFAAFGSDNGIQESVVWDEPMGLERLS